MMKMAFVPMGASHSCDEVKGRRRLLAILVSCSYSNHVKFFVLLAFIFESYFRLISNPTTLLLNSYVVPLLFNGII